MHEHFFQIRSHLIALYLRISNYISMYDLFSFLIPYLAVISPLNIKPFKIF